MPTICLKIFLISCIALSAVSVLLAVRARDAVLSFAAAAETFRQDSAAGLAGERDLAKNFLDSCPLVPEKIKTRLADVLLEAAGRMMPAA